MARRKVKNDEKSPWAEKHKSFLAPIRSQNGGDRLETGLVRHCPQGLFSFFRPFRLSLAPTICPLASEDGVQLNITKKEKYKVHF